ncbi:MAG: sigma-70 family RNA polymerase sigma factor, partial [Anaerolineae bacterium]|nr:sigma-70 family RNA polymerase sigma factor [Anaerolineae bacterium]
LENQPDQRNDGPLGELEAGRFGSALERALGRLPNRQQQAFLLRAWEGLSVEEAAQAMGCSAGSVKTHYSRAVHTLREQLEEFRG